MIRQTIYIRRYDWTLHCYYAVDTYYVREIMDELAAIGCSPVDMYKARKNMLSGNNNQGVTFSNPNIRETVLVTSLTSSAAEFFNSLVHELMHVTMHISQHFGMEPGGEEQAYLIGGLCRTVYPEVRELLCSHCHKIKWS